MPDYVEQFIGELRDRAADREREKSPLAAAYARVADELEEKRQEWLLTEPTLEEAVRESGYSEVALRRLKREGKWSGKRLDLPRRPRTPQRRGPQSLAEDVLSRRQRVG